MVGPLVSLVDSTFRNNRGTGLELLETGATVVEGNEISNNTGNGVYGVYISNSGGQRHCLVHPASHRGAVT